MDDLAEKVREEIEGMEYIKADLKRLREESEKRERIITELMSNHLIVCGDEDMKNDLEVAFPNEEVYCSPYIDSHVVLITKRLIWERK